MKNPLALILLLIGALVAQAAPAQVTVDQTGNVKPVPSCVYQTDGTCTPVSASNPLPVTGGGGGGGGGNTTDVAGTGTLALGTANATYVIPLTGGRGIVGLRISGLTGSGATITAERTNDGGTVYTNANTTESSTTGSLSSTLTVDGQPRINASGATAIRLRVSTTGTGTASIAYNATTSTGGIFFTSYIPSYTTPDGKIIGGVDNRFINGTAISTGSGVTDAGTQRVVHASNDPVVIALPAKDSNGDLRVPTVTATPYFVSLAANTSTELLATSTTRIAFDVQCTGTATVGLSRTHATLTSATPSAGGADLVIPSGTTPYFLPPYVSNLGVTAYTGTAQACWGVSYARQ